MTCFCLGEKHSLKMSYPPKITGDTNEQTFDWTDTDTVSTTYKFHLKLKVTKRQFLSCLLNFGQPSAIQWNVMTVSFAFLVLTEGQNIFTEKNSQISRTSFHCQLLFYTAWNKSLLNLNHFTFSDQKCELMHFCWCE